MAFVRRRGRRWYVRYISDTGEPVEHATKATSKTEAVRLADDLERRAERVRLGLEHEVKPITISEAYEKHYKPIVQARDGFVPMDSRFRNHIIPELGKKLAHHVRPADVQALLAKKAREGLSPATCEHIRVELSGLFTFIIDDMKAFRGEHPVRQVKKVRIQEKEPTYLEPAEVIAVAKQIPARWKPFIATAVLTGVRYSELRRLKITDVDFERRLITVSRTKTGRLRKVAIPEDLAAVLAHHIGDRKEGWLFTRPKGGQLTNNSGALRMFKRAGKRAGLDRALTIKDLRSTFATHMAEFTGDLRVVQRALGHGSIATTEKKYAAARDRHLVQQSSGFSLGAFARSLPVSVTESEQTTPIEANVTWLDRANQNQPDRGETSENKSKQLKRE